MSPSAPSPHEFPLAESERGCGERLRRAREAAGLSLADVSQRLKMPVRVVESLENEDWSRLGAPVFIRGQLRSYSRLLGLATAPVQAAATDVAPVAPSVLTPRSYTPPMQHMAEQLARRLVYVVITAAIVVPVWLATRSQLAERPAQTASLDTPAALALPAASQQAATDPAERPLVASMVPASAPVPRKSLHLAFHGDSWVNIIAPDGRVLEQALVKAGETRDYAVGEVASMTLGNASAVQLTRDGQAQDLAAFGRANVARFTVSSDGSLAPR